MTALDGGRWVVTSGDVLGDDEDYDDEDEDEDAEDEDEDDEDDEDEDTETWQVSRPTRFR